MGKMRMVDTDFWTDSWVVDNLNPLDAHLFMYLFTNPQTNVAGVYKLSIKIMSFQIGIEKEELARMLKRLEPKVYYVDGWVILRNGIKNQNYNSPKMKTAIYKIIEAVPNELLQYVNWPKDFEIIVSSVNKQQSLLTPEKYGIDTLSHVNSNYNSNNNYNHNASEDAGGFKKTITTKKQKASYAKAVQADKDLELRSVQANNRKGYSKFTEIGEQLKNRKLKK